MLQDIIKQSNEFEKRIKKLKDVSPYWPDYITKNYKDGEIYFSTNVRIYRDKWYTVHCVESANQNLASYNEAVILDRLIEGTYNIIHLYKLCGHEDIDVLQISEEERLLKLYGETTIKNNRDSKLSQRSNDC